MPTRHVVAGAVIAVGRVTVGDGAASGVVPTVVAVIAAMRSRDLGSIVVAVVAFGVGGPIFPTIVGVVDVIIVRSTPVVVLVAT